MSFVLIVVVVVRPWGGHDRGWATHLNLTDEPLDNYSRSVETLINPDGGAPIEIWQRASCSKTTGNQTEKYVSPVSYDLEPCGDDPQREWVAHGCAGCHGLDGTGGVVGPTAIEVIGAKFGEQIRFGANGMPAFSESDLSDEHIALLTDYLATVRAKVFPGGIPPTPTPVPTPTPQPTATPAPSGGSNATAPTPAAEPPSSDLLKLGREVFEVTAGTDGCAYCHGFDGTGNGQGGESAPNIVGADRSQVREALRGAFDMSDIKLSRDELAAVIEYLQFLATGN